ncbi:MAG: hypothetical protein M3P93_04315, partial [Actinomycetota bacterium]|nr:hypothetical protein [Actinomycetota bacterium]
MGASAVGLHAEPEALVAEVQPGERSGGAVEHDDLGHEPRQHGQQEQAGQRLQRAPGAAVGLAHRGAQPRRVRRARA